MKTKFLLLLPIVALLFTGCAIVPVPLPSDGQTHGKVIVPKDVNFMVPGRTTRAEVVAKLGDQFRESPRLPVLAYAWEKPAVGIGWVWLLVSRDCGAVGAGGVERCHWQAFFVEFDSVGRVKRNEFISLSQHHSLDEQLEDWARKTSRSQIGDGVFNPDTGAPRFVEAFANNNEALGRH